MFDGLGAGCCGGNRQDDGDSIERHNAAQRLRPPLPRGVQASPEDDLSCPTPSPTRCPTQYYSTHTRPIRRNRVAPHALARSLGARSSSSRPALSPLPTAPRLCTSRPVFSTRFLDGIRRGGQDRTGTGQGQDRYPQPDRFVPFTRTSNSPAHPPLPQVARVHHLRARRRMLRSRLHREEGGRPLEHDGWDWDGRRWRRCRRCARCARDAGGAER